MLLNKVFVVQTVILQEKTISMNKNITFDSNKQTEGSFIRRTLEENIASLIKMIVERFKLEATPAYARMDDATLRKIVEGALKQTCGWLEDGPAARIEADLQVGLQERLKMGFTVRDFISTTGIIEDECKKYCQRLFQEDATLAEHANRKLSFIYINVNLIETRLAMKYRMDGKKQISSKK